jgi:TRAP-type transport system periplasmic protein
MTRTFYTTVALLVALASHANAQPASRTVRIATLAPEGSLWMKQLEKAAARIGQATEGRVAFKYYAGGSQGDEKDMIRKMRSKHLDGAALTGLGLSQIYSGIFVLQLPNMFADVEELDYVRDKMWPYFQTKFREHGYELLSQADLGWIHLFSTKPIRSLADLRKTKMWVWQGNANAEQIAESLGVSGVPLGVPEVLPALTTGRIDTVFNSPLGAVALQWHSQLRYMSSQPLGYGIASMVVRKDVYQLASKKDADIMLKIGQQLASQSKKMVRRDNERALRAMRSEGMQVVETPKDMRELIERESKAAWTAYVGKLYSKAELETALRYRDEYRARKAQRASK